MRARALLAVLLDDAVGDLDDRLDRQRRRQQRLGVADAPALLQVVERVERAEHAGAGDELARRALDGVEVGAGGGRLGAGEGDRAEAERDRAAVDDAHVEAVGGDGAGGQLGALHRGRQRAGDRDDDDAGGAPVGEAAVGLLEAAGRRRGRRRQLGRRRAAGPELGRRQLLAVDQLLVAEADAERDDLDAPLLDEVVGEVAGAVGDDADGRARWAEDRSRVGDAIGAGLLGRTGAAVASAASGETCRASWTAGLSTSPSIARRSRRRRRKCPNHHDTSTSTAPPVTTWPRPVRALTRAVSTTGSVDVLAERPA